MTEIFSGMEHAWISHDPAKRAGAEPGVATDWLELLVDGLTFDLLGLAPGPALAVPAIRHRFEFEGDGGEFEAIGIAPGPHLVAARAAIPVVRAMALLGVDLINAEGIDACGCVWLPAGSAMGLRYFQRVVDNWADGGPFPALGFAGVSRSPTGVLRSDGLSFFTGQEFRIREDADQGSASATRLLVRMIDSFVGSPALESPVRLRGPDDRLYEASPSEDGSTIFVAAVPAGEQP